MNSAQNIMDKPGPYLLSPDLFTSAKRTPWGSRWILDVFKAALPRPLYRLDASVVGESWEASTDPAMQSEVLAADGERQALTSLLQKHGAKVLGKSVFDRTGPALPLLVKIISAADNLSVQVHPAEDSPLVGSGFSGKTEAWLILDAEPDACLYLGSKPGIEPAIFFAAMERGADLSPLLQRVPVRKGDYCLIPPGLIHAIGKGISLYEVQTSVPGKSGITYRCWDWGRRYNEEGRLDSSGKPRQLHLAECRQVARLNTAISRPLGNAFLKSEETSIALVEQPFALKVRQADLQKAARWLLQDRFELLTLCEGQGLLTWDGGSLSVLQGQTILLPAWMREVELSCQNPLSTAIAVSSGPALFCCDQ